RIAYSRSLHGHVSHSSLPSFPTRRSSDLVFGRRKRTVRADLERVVERADQTLSDPCGDRRVSIALWTHLDELAAQQLEPLILEQDRKSTRLNSSHVSISYAVFCLKKKKSR